MWGLITIPNIFSRLFKKGNSPQNSLTTSRPFFFGRASSDVAVNERTALATAGGYACVRIISEAVAQLPLHLYKYEGNGALVETGHPLSDILHTVPNPEMTSFIWREVLMSHILLWGNGYCQLIRDGTGRIKHIYPLLPNKMDVWRNDDGEIYYTYYRDSDETRPHEKKGGITLRREDVLHIPGLSFDGLVGYSPIALAKNAIGMAIAAEDYGANFFANGANPGGVLEHPSTLNDPTKIRTTWEAIYRGKGAHRIAVLEDGLTFRQVGIPPDQAQFLETRRFQLNEIARIFRVPPHLIGDLDKATYSNIEHQGIEFVMHTVEPWVIRLEQAMDMALLTPAERKKYMIKFNLDGLLRGDYKTRMEGYSIGRQGGWLSANDIRALERMTPIPKEEGGDKYMVNGNMVDLKNAGHFARKDDNSDE
ncbi:MAG: phage portal protein [Defluviitaleaceae bacterium]|nr:phage portal protein [Defluviitaleaceae bacterium]MCL2263813.1 phage portal protein [Defluviitaleaceae bacterium]